MVTIRFRAVTSLLLKLVYSALLLGIATVVMRELWTVWFDNRVYIGKFDVVSDSGIDAEASEEFARRIVAAQMILAQQLTDFQSRQTGKGPSDTTYAISGMTPLFLPSEILGGVDITVQDFKVSQLLTVIRRGFLAPNEVSGHVTERAGSVLAAIEWPRAPHPTDGSPPLTKFFAPGKASSFEVAAYIASSISWAQTASRKTSYSALSRAQFCDFVTALGDLYTLQEKASSATGLDAEEVKLVRKRTAVLRAHYGEIVVLPDMYRLRADLFDLLPEGVRTQGELVEAQEDRLRYAMLGEDVEKLPAEEKRMAALALARPAIVLEDGKLRDTRENWASLLARYTADIEAAAKGTGMIVGGSSSTSMPLGTGFIVGPGLMMTASHVLQMSKADPNAEATEEGNLLRLCFGGRTGADCRDSLSVGKITYNGEVSGSHIVLAQLVGHDPLAHPPLPIADLLPEPNAITGRYAYVIGYPFPDPRLPAEFNAIVLGNLGGWKRLMPGRILGYGPSGSDTAQQMHFTTDISTSSGTGGGPLMDMLTGKVIGVSYAGTWQGERGKFAYAEPIPKEALDFIAGRSSGKADDTAGAGGTGASESQQL